MRTGWPHFLHLIDWTRPANRFSQRPSGITKRP
jgi:hypothetical protein